MRSALGVSLLVAAGLAGVYVVMSPPGKKPDASNATERGVQNSGRGDSPVSEQSKNSPGAIWEPAPLEISPSAQSHFLRTLQSILASAALEEDDERREQILTRLETLMAGHDAASALEFLDTQEPIEIIVEARDRILRQWAKSDPRAAANAALGLSHHRQRGVDVVIGEWAAADLEAALGWADQLPDGGTKQGSQWSLAREAIRTEPKLAIEIASELEYSSELEDLVTHAAAEWTGRDPEAAAAWAQEADAGPLRERLVAAVATAMGDADPGSAAEFAMEALAPGRSLNDALVGIVQRWVQTDAQAAAGWVGRFPEGPLRNDAIENLVKLWASQDPRAPSIWIESLPAGLGRDSALRAYSEQIAASNPARAAAWAGSISDAELRQRQSEAIAELWMRADPSPATAWIERMPFPPRTKARLLAIRANGT